MKFAKQLHSEKSRLGLTLAGMVAELENVSQRTIEHWLNDTRTPHVWMQDEALRRLRAKDSPPNV